MKTTPFENDPLRLVSHCPLCETREQSMQTHILAEEGNTKLVHVTCRKCGGATISLLLENEAGASTVGLVTDLSHEDARKFSHGRRVSTDDVIDVHEALSQGIAGILKIKASRRKHRTTVKTRVKTRRTTAS